MKKIFTLIVSAVLATSAFAQYGQGNKNGGSVYNNDRDVVYNNKDNNRNGNWNDKSYYYSKREMDMDVAQIKRKYDRKIDEVKSNWFMTRFKKERIIRTLEEQRKAELKDVYAKFSDRHNKFDDHSDWRRH